VGIGEDVGHVGDRATANRARGQCLVIRPHREGVLDGLDPLWRDAVKGDQVDQLAVEPRYHAHGGVAQLLGALSDDVEDRLNVGRRARDDPNLDVAVCCSSVSVRSWLRTSSSLTGAFSMAMTWSAKVVTSSIWLSRMVRPSI
jgi:hypothetical protein